MGALQLYVRNTALSESLFGVIQGLEVSLRNVIHETLTAGLGRTDWYDTGILEWEQQRARDQAKKALEREGKPLGPGCIVAELPFGFWTGLTGVKYADLWRDHIVRAFPNRNLQRTESHYRLDKIRKLRNRIAHHEPILSRPLAGGFSRILATIAWIAR